MFIGDFLNGKVKSVNRKEKICSLRSVVVFKSQTKNKWIILSLKILWQKKTEETCLILGLDTFDTTKTTNDK